MITEKLALVLDDEDPLRKYRNEFYLQKRTYYFNNEPLMIKTKKAQQMKNSILNEWKQYGQQSTRKEFLPSRNIVKVISHLCTYLIGAKANEVLITGKNISNLDEFTSFFYKPTASKYKIIVDEDYDPDMISVLQKRIKASGYNSDSLVFILNKDYLHRSEKTIINMLEDDVALVLLHSFANRGGRVLKSHEIVEAAHAKGILLGLDLTTQFSAIPFDLHILGIDFAIWSCNSYEDGGVHSNIKGLFVHEQHFDALKQLTSFYEKIVNDAVKDATEEDELYSLEKIISYVPMLSLLEIICEVGIEKIRKKSLRLTQFFIDLVYQELPSNYFTFENALDSSRGVHVTILHENAHYFVQALHQRGVLVKFKSPDGICFAPNALYTSFSDIWKTVQILKEIINEQSSSNYRNLLTTTN